MPFYTLRYELSTFERFNFFDQIIQLFAPFNINNELFVFFYPMVCGNQQLLEWRGKWCALVAAFQLTVTEGRPIWRLYCFALLFGPLYSRSDDSSLTRSNPESTFGFVLLDSLLLFCPSLKRFKFTMKFPLDLTGLEVFKLN